MVEAVHFYGKGEQTNPVGVEQWGVFGHEAASAREFLLYEMIMCVCVCIHTVVHLHSRLGGGGRCRANMDIFSFPSPSSKSFPLVLLHYYFTPLLHYPCQVFCLPARRVPGSTNAYSVPAHRPTRRLLQHEVWSTEYTVP